MSSSIPPATDPSAPAPSDRLWLRSELMGTQVITRDTGRRLGVVGEVVVDIDRREVVALGLRDNPLTRFLPGLPRWMPLGSIRQVGDVILVDTADSLSESFNPERYSKVINCQVITESGVQLGRVLGFSFDIETGELSTLVIGALGVPLLGEGVLSTWELAVGEIVSSGTDRIIVYEGSEEKLKQLGTGLLEKLGIGGNSWEEEERERYRSGMIPAENQLPAGTASASEQRRLQPSSSRAVLPESELDYLEVEERREREPLRQRRYLDEDEPEELRRRDAYDEEPPRGGAYRPVSYREQPDRDGAYRQETSRDEAFRDASYGRRSADAAQDWRRQPEPGGRGLPEEREVPPRRRSERFDADDDGRQPRFRDDSLRSNSLRDRQDEDRFRDRSEVAAPPPARAGADRDDDASRGRSASEREGRDRFAAEPWREARRDVEPPQPPAGETFQEPSRADRDPRERAFQARPAAESAPSGAGRPAPAEPIDVEPEVLDDPW